jgi:hypothetical protein
MYVAGLAAAAALDPDTPLGVADWLLEVVLVWIATTWGGPGEMVAVAVAGSATMLLGLLTSRLATVPLWMGALNRLVAVGVIWTMVHVSRRRRIAEAAREKAAADIKVLEGLLPIRASCKCIRSGGGEWHPLESYISNHSQARFSHTYCPACAKKYLEDAGAMAGD